MNRSRCDPFLLQEQFESRELLPTDLTFVFLTCLFTFFVTRSSLESKPLSHLVIFSASHAPPPSMILILILGGRRGGPGHTRLSTSCHHLACFMFQGARPAKRRLGDLINPFLLLATLSSINEQFTNTQLKCPSQPHRNLTTICNMFLFIQRLRLNHV